jgi:hypothetical protein
MKMTEYRMMAEHGNWLCGEERMGKAKQEMGMAEHEMIGYSCNLNK